MLEGPQVQKLMQQLIAGKFPNKSLLQVISEPGEDAEGQDALRITLVLAESAIDVMTPDQIASLLTEVHDCLIREGDERFPLISYSTPADLLAAQNENDED